MAQRCNHARPPPVYLTDNYASVGRAHRRHTVVVTCVCVCVSEWVCHSVRYCSHFLCNRWTLRAEMCNASLMQCYLEIELVNFGLETLLSMICSPWRLFPAVQSPAKDKSLITGCLSTWQFNLYNNPDGDQSEIQRTRLPKLHSLSCLPQHTTDCVHSWRQGLIWHPPMSDCVVVYIVFPGTVLYVHKQLPATSKLTQDSRPAAIMLLALCYYVWILNLMAEDCCIM